MCRMMMRYAFTLWNDCYSQVTIHVSVTSSSYDSHECRNIEESRNFSEAMKFSSGHYDIREISRIY